MKKYILFFILIISVCSEPTQEEINTVLAIQKTIQSYKCKGSSPFFEIKYGQENISDLHGVSFCYKQSQRTCCNQDNFDQLRLEWYKYIYNTVDISPQCQGLLNEIICSECDADIGQGLRQGLCSHVCQQLYKACFLDYFRIDEKTKKLRICQQNDLLCSQLKFIVHKSEDFCKMLGYQVNLNFDYSEWADDLLFNNTNFNPACYDGVPSSKYMGPAKYKSGNYSHEKFQDKIKDKFKQTKDSYQSKIQWLNYVLYISVSVLAIVIIGIIWWIFQQTKSNRGIRIGGSKKKKEDKKD